MYCIVVILNLIMVLAMVYGRSTLEKFKCERAGLSPHPENCRKFVICAENSETRELTATAIFNCPAGQVFSNHAFTCVSEDQVPECSDAPAEKQLLDETMRSHLEPSVCLIDGAFCDYESNSLVICSEIGGNIIPFFSVECKNLDDHYPMCCEGATTCTSSCLTPDIIEITNRHWPPFFTRRTTPTTATTTTITTIRPPTSTTRPPVTCLSSGTSVPDPTSTDCKAYYTCNLINGVMVIRPATCDYPYMAFSPIYGYCINEYYVECPNRSG